jgi:thiol-disulfide isomerase/thioredoxin
MRPLRRLRLTCLVVVLTAALAACTTAGPPQPDPANLPSAQPGSGSPAAGLTSDPLHTVGLYDVTTETPFTLGQLAANGPVLLEMMAIWCTNCRIQQGEIRAAHDLAAFDSVSLDIDPNERPGDLAAYSASNGFAWRYATANADLATALRDRFGPAVLNPPSTPMVLLSPDGSIQALEFRAWSAQELAAAIGAN